MITAEDEPVASPGGGPSLGAEPSPPPPMASGAPGADPDEGRVSIPVTTPGGGLRAAPLPDGPTPLGLPVVLAPISPISPIAPQRQRPRPTRAPLGEPRGTLRTRFLHGAVGSLLLTLFFVPWSNAYSWELLPGLVGAAFVRQLLFLVGGVTFLSTALLPVPPLFRGVIGLLLGVFGLSLGGVMLSPWQNLMAALSVLLLPASLILVSWQSRGTPGLPTLRMQRALGVLGGVALLSLYFVPREGAAPLKVAIELLRYHQDDAARFLGTYLLLPLPLLGFSLVALLSEDVAILGELLGWLLCAYGPGALLILLIDSTQAYVAAAVLGYSLCGAYGLVTVLQRLSATSEPR